MADSRPIADRAQRDRALDPERSFLVQAPAGSGKTELLIQRYLLLLARVQRPEEVLAITFTRKAAGEMRERIVTALQRARGPAPEEDHARRTWTLARGVLTNDERQGWALPDHPGRMRIQTIDALCAELTRQLPLQAGFGAAPAIEQRPDALYREAARRALGLLDEEPWGADVAALLAHLDNYLPRAEALLAEMLKRRDHWLRHVAGDGSRIDREALEQAIVRVVEETLQACDRSFSAALKEEVMAVARYAADNVVAMERDSVIAALIDIDRWPAATMAALPCWHGIAELLLTGSGAWRRQGGEAQGFPAPSRASGQEKARREDGKRRLKALLAALSGDEALCHRLAQVRELPQGRYGDGQWQVLDALMRLLRLAAAQLRLVFAERGAVDFAELAMAAGQALGSPEAPTDLALALDYRIRHILVDEFQDTSLRQYDLLACLTGGWTPGDGRTLFVVGDPMQSIYRFREAEVGLYLRARREGLPNVPLEVVTLAVNFRSQADLVEWVNRAFPVIFPGREERAAGGVPYSPSTAIRESGTGEAVIVHPMLEPRHDDEGRQVVALVRELRERDADGSVAILVRARSHLAEILPRLRAAGLRYQAVEIDALAARPAVQDVLALTRALHHPADRIAWLAVLRAPWCGLTLPDLERLAGDDRRHTTIPERMDDATVLDALSPTGRRRVERVAAVLAAAVDELGTRPLRRLVEGAWVALGGPATLAGEEELADVAACLDLIEAMERAGRLDSVAELEAGLAGLFAAPDARADGRLQVMTIHKAKGLEFDTVILPGLGRPPARGSDPLLRWLELPGGGNDLLMAPLRPRGAEREPIYQLLKRLDAERGRYEDGRLLYVAATRARRRLHLLGHCRVTEGGPDEATPRVETGSLLAQLWPVVSGHYAAPPGRVDAGTVVPSQPIAQRLSRLPVDWVMPAAPDPAFTVTAVPASGDASPEFEWAGETARCVGVVIHRMLQRIGGDGVESWDRSRIEAMERVLAGQLQQLGVPRPEREAALRRVVAALANVLADPRARWILADHPHAEVEWALAGVDGGELIHVTIDRSFVDEDGVRWIIDYKTGGHLGAGISGFLDREEARYRPQLERYARLLARREERSIRLGLYFPLLSGWREWPFGAGAQPA